MMVYSHNEKLLPNITFEKAVTAFVILTVAVIPLLFYQGVNYVMELPKMIALSVMTPLLFFLLRCIPDSRHQSGGYLGIVIYAYLGWLFINCLFSLDPVISFLGYYGNFTGFFFYLLSFSFFFLGNHFQEHKVKFIYPLLIAATLLAGISIIQFCTEGLVRAMGTQGHPINLANYLILIIPCCIGLLLAANPLKRWVRAFLFFSLFLITTALILSFSRAGWAGLVFLLLLFLVTLGKNIIKRNIRILLAISGILLLAILSVYFITHYQPSRVMLNSNQIETTTQPVDISRIHLMTAAWQVFIHYPFGAGLSTFYFTATPYLAQELREKAVFTYAHNDFLHTLATQGVVGGLFYLAIVLLLVKMWWEWRKNSARDGLTAAIWAGVFAHLLMLQSNFPAYGYTYLFWFFIGFLNNPAYLSALPFRPMKHHEGRLIIKPFYQKLFWGVLFVAALYYSIVYFLADSSYLRATLAGKQGAYDAAAPLFKRSIQLTPWVEQYKLAKLENDIEIYQSPKTAPQKRSNAFQMIKQELLFLNSLNPLNHRYKAAIGDALIALKSYDKAIIFFKQASELYPNHPDYYDRIGYSLIQLSKNREAKGYFQKSLRLDPQNQYAADCLRLLEKDRNQK